MKKVTPINKRKADHIKINLEQDVRSSLTNGLERFAFVHEALPEIDLNSIDTTYSLFGKNLNAPILISSMTGGTREAKIVNQRLAEAAQELNIAMGVGSQRAAIEQNSLIDTFTIARHAAPNIVLFANLGAIQLNMGYTIDECRRAVNMLQADALVLHLNPLQEALQDGGDTNFKDLSNKIESICKNIEVPVIIKEVGWGISKRTAKLLSNCGVAAIDVAGAGGTSWSQVEMHRAPNEFSRQLAASFNHWGITTADSILNVTEAAPDMLVFASGGLRDGLDITKCIALGAKLGGMAGRFLQLAVISNQQVVEFGKLLIQQMKVAMFSSGKRNLNNLYGSLVSIK